MTAVIITGNISCIKESSRIWLPVTVLTAVFLLNIARFILTTEPLSIMTRMVSRIWPTVPASWLRISVTQKERAAAIQVLPRCSVICIRLAITGWEPSRCTVLKKLSCLRCAVLHVLIASGITERCMLCNGVQDLLPTRNILYVCICRLP